MKKQVLELWQLMKRSKFPHGLIIFVLLLGIVDTAIGLVIPLLTMDLINNFSIEEFAWTTLVIVVAALVLQAVFSGMAYFFMRMLGERVVANMRKYLWEHVLHLKIPFFDSHETGDTMSRITQDTSIVKELVTNHLVSFVTGMFSIIGAVGILLWIDWKMTLLMLVSVPLAIIAMLPLGAKMHKISKANQDQLARFSGQLGRILSNIRLVKATQTEAKENTEGEKSIEALYGYGMKEAKILAFLSPIMTLIMMVVLILIFGYGGAQIAAGHISAGELVAIMIYLVQIIIPFTQMATFFTALQKALGATERIQQMIREPIEQFEGASLPTTLQPLTFNEVAFNYGEKSVLQNMSFTIPAGKTTAFVSQSGGGKTTMFSLIERFYEVSAGAIEYGNNNIETFDLAKWRGLIGYVSQEAPLLNGTIRDNLLYGNPQANEQQLKEALIAANAWDFVNKLSEGLNTQVGENGIKLSGGQKQRLAIARAILRNPQILLLDEATSNLDNESEREVQAALTHLMKGRTTIVIAHRLSTITNADQILVFEEGKLSGKGTHDALIQHHEYYKQLWQSVHV
ncbi:ABC transporter ATP-binding protein [Solibacillus sp. FSL R7-0668]|uniref:ABC transporter ATP-binding protein n=1 Tax=Solibacillus sp. FSL R7-0668 TaxID=2921688 RepID=UPI0030F98F37